MKDIKNCILSILIKDVNSTPINTEHNTFNLINKLITFKLFHIDGAPWRTYISLIGQ